MTILLNPKNGSDIKKVLFRDQWFFKDEAFKTDSLVSVEDAVANFLLDTFGFLVEMSPSEAKKYLEKRQQKSFSCTKCDFSTDTKVALAGHMRSHEPDVDVSKLGIPTIQGKGKDVQEEDQYGKWDQEDKDAGLEGEGLVDDAVHSAAVSF